MVGSIVEVGLGKVSLDYIKMVLSTDKNKIKVKTKSMPPQGLCLVKVSYEEFPPQIKLK